MPVGHTKHIADILDILITDGSLMCETRSDLRKLKEKIEERITEELPAIKGAQYTMVQVSVEEWAKNYYRNNTKGIPQYFYVNPKGDIEVWPKPDGPVKYMLTVKVG